MKILTNSEALLMENIVSVSQESLQNVLYKFLNEIISILLSRAAGEQTPPHVLLFLHYVHVV